MPAGKKKMLYLFCMGLFSADGISNTLCLNESCFDVSISNHVNGRLYTFLSFRIVFCRFSLWFSVILLFLSLRIVID